MIASRPFLPDPEDREEKALDSGGLPVLTRENDRMGWKRRRWCFQGSFKNPSVHYIMVAFIDQVNIHQVPTTSRRLWKALEIH